MPVQPRERFNTKGRQGSRKKGKQRKQKAHNGPEMQEDSNADIITPKSDAEKDKERKEKLLQELAAQSESKWSSKKKKRLEKYIEKKLKKEERVLIFEKLLKTQASLPSSLLQSSSTLGTGRLATHEELQARSEDKDRKRHRDAYDVSGPLDDNDSDDASLNGEVRVENEGSKTASGKEVIVVESASTQISKSTVTLPVVGGALQRNPDGSIVTPNIRPRKKKRLSTRKGWGLAKPHTSSAGEDSDTSFDSSDSAYDSMEDDAESWHGFGSDTKESKDTSLENALAINAEGNREAGEDDDNTDDDEKEKDDGSENDASGEDEDEDELAKKRSLGFKDWAMKQLSATKSYITTPGAENMNTPAEPLPVGKKQIHNRSHPGETRGPLGADLQLPQTTFSQRLLAKETEISTYIKSIEVKRPPDVEESRLLLPIVTEEQPIMEAVLLNPVVIICGETGSGKTTQVPQFLYEAGFGTPGSENPGMIGVTQPRRVAAMSMASRVAHELSLASSKVSHQIRYDATVSPSTSIKFMTDGVLLRELATDFLLSKYSVIIIDEAHERSMNTDILIGVLSRVIKLREEMWKEGREGARPLRLIIMSATLRVSDFAENKTLFSVQPPVINVAARQHPVTIHFSRRTSSDYISEAVKKASKIHARLPPGGILIFLTGQNEITGVCRRLEAKFGRRALEEKSKRKEGLQARLARFAEQEFALEKKNVSPAHADVEAEDLDLGDTVQEELAMDVDDGMQEDDPEALDSDEEDAVDKELGIDMEESEVPMYIVPLYSLLSSEKQMRVFQPPPPDARLVVVATNVAETSLTIPGIRYVVDCGRAKERRYDLQNDVQAFQVSWISKASAAQRAGRAGRTGPGHCYRLYSSALFEHHFEQFSQPEILRMPIEGVVLQMKSMHIDAVINFPFPTPPNRSTLQKAEKTLVHLGALSDANTATSAPGTNEVITAHITPLGRNMSLFPLSPRFSRMLVSAQQHGCLPYIVSIVSAMSVGDPFLYEEAIQNDSDGDEHVDTDKISNLKSEAVKAKEARRLRRKAFYESQHIHGSLGNFMSDMFKILSVVGAYSYAGGGQKFCTDHFVRPKAMEEIHKLRAQISNIVQVNFPSTDAGFSPNLKPPTELQLKVIRQLLTAGFIDQVAVRKELVDRDHATGVKYATAKGVAYKAIGVSEDVYIHPSSVVANSTPPDYVVYHEIVRTGRAYLKGVTVVNPSWLSSLGKPSLCTFYKPLKNNAGTLMVIPKFGPEGWELPAIKA
ncbi:P-loop containing nucleoside triphosphate hydrolase protein [Cyathus striatus]|nr:P-loop containing nucleoside triphosphate hydrolase protein [Cyathus striatus]